MYSFTIHTGGELFEYILAHTRLEEDEACALFAQLVSSIHYMHQKGVVHRDLKLVRFERDEYSTIANLRCLGEYPAYG